MNNGNFPKIIYGTAWKESATTHLVEEAILAGFTAIDTANQPRHYSESLVGEALLKLKEQGIPRENLFLQTKFTSPNGQDHRIPYDPKADIATQVESSFQSSLKHLRTDYLDSYLLHGPYSGGGLVEEDWQVWEAIEKLYTADKAKHIGVSNVNIMQLKLLVQGAKIKPMMVQNRCFAELGWDKAVREFCRQHQIMYQGFSLLTANREAWGHEKVAQIAQRLNKTPAQVILRFATLIGITPLTGTTDKKHMQQDLQIFDFDLSVEEIDELEWISIDRNIF
jgi:diketogulonate reductase-like aldo/keto reductase